MHIRTIFSGFSPENRFSSPEIGSPVTALRVGISPQQEREAEGAHCTASEQCLIRRIYGSSPPVSAKNLSAEEVGCLFDDIETAPHIQSHFKDFYINLAVLNYAMSQLPKSEKILRTKLAARILNYAYKFSTYHYLSAGQYANNPIQRNDWKEEKYEAGYHRFDDTGLKKAFRLALAKLLQIPEQNIKPVTSPEIHNLVKRNYVLHDNFDVLKWNDGGTIDLTGNQRNTSASFSTEFPNIAGAMLQIMSPDKRPLYFDISESLDRLSKNLIHPNDAGIYIRSLQTFLRDVIEYGIKEKIKTTPQYLEKTNEEEKSAYADACLKDLMEHVHKRVLIGGILKVEKQYVLYNGKLARPEESWHSWQSGAKKSVTAGELKRLRFRSPMELEPLHKDDENFQKTASIHGGFVPPPLAIMENWFSITGKIDPIFRALEIEKENTLRLLAPDDVQPLSSFKNFKDFLEHEVVQTFKNLPESSTAPYLKILPKVTYKLIEALQDCDVDNTFDAATLTPILQFSYIRILSGMQHAASEKENFPAFLNRINLIHEEIATLLAIVEPYRKTDFNELMQKITQNNRHRHGMTPMFYFKNSGMSCIQSALSASEKNIFGRDGTGSLKIGTANNSYFENHLISSYGKLHRVSQIDSIDAQSKTLDVFFGHFHPSCSLDATHYEPENMISRVDALFEKSKASKHLLIVIDNTIAMSSEEKMAEFLEHNKSRIQSGKMSVVDMRSMQKFDQSGMDMYAGGLIAVYSTSPSLLHAFAADDEKTSYSQTNLQGMMHFAKTVQPELDERRAQIMKIAKRFTTPDDPIGFPPSMYASDTCEGLLQIVPNSDPRVPFFHIRLNNRFIENLGEILANHLARKGARSPEDFPLVFRESFGFNRTTCTNIDNHVRVTPGLEDEGYFKNYRDYLVLLNNVLLEAIKKFPMKKEAVLANVLLHGDELIELIERCINDQAFLALPNTKSRLAEAWERVVFPLKIGR